MILEEIFSIEGKIVMGVLALAGLAVGWFYVQGLRMENRTLKRELAFANEAVTRLEGQLEYGQKALGQAMADADRLRAEYKAVMADLGEIYEVDEEACDWGSTAVPASILGRLCR
ncbi:MAG: hypothetical protein LBL95_02860 [Deltaproteobacteria bacterium]|jgi:hypothetical protein|nr:hypothetical protein [Deltaproteobacteria bacterium]